MNYKVDLPEVKAIMARKGYNIGTLAAEMGVSRDTVSAFLKGKNPTYQIMCKLMDALDIDLTLANAIFFAQDLRIA